MEKISVALARLDRIKELLKGWEQRKAISNIERSIVLNQLASLYDDLLGLSISENKVSETVPNRIEKAEPEKQNINTSATDITVAEKENETETIVQTPSTLKAAAVESMEDDIDSSVTQNNQEKTVRLGDKFAGLQKYLYENFENKDDTSLSRFSAIDDINRAIGINDRFLFIKELFNGDKDLFNKAISALNSCGSLNDALMYIHENFSWNSEDLAVKQLVLLLYRRYK